MTDPVAPRPADGAVPSPSTGAQPGREADGSAAEPTAGPAPESAPESATEPAAAPAKKSAVKKVLLLLGVLVVVAAVVFGLRSLAAADPTKDAKAGDCIGIDEQVGEKEARVKPKMVDCSSADAKYTVVGRVNGEKDTNSTSCDKFYKDGDDPYVLSNEEGAGYLLCVVAKK